jgi:hypothetical protein
MSSSLEQFFIHSTSVIARLALAFSLALGAAGCGVKNDLVLPDGKPSPKGQKDPSKPPQQQER